MNQKYNCPKHCLGEECKADELNNDSYCISKRIVLDCNFGKHHSPDRKQNNAEKTPCSKCENHNTSNNCRPPSNSIKVPFRCLQNALLYQKKRKCTNDECPQISFYNKGIPSNASLSCENGSKPIQRTASILIRIHRLKRSCSPKENETIQCRKQCPAKLAAEECSLKAYPSKKSSITCIPLESYHRAIINRKGCKKQSAACVCSPSERKYQSPPSGARTTKTTESCANSCPSRRVTPVCKKTSNHNCKANTSVNCVCSTLEAKVQTADFEIKQKPSLTKCQSKEACISFNTISCQCSASEGICPAETLKMDTSVTCVCPTLEAKIQTQSSPLKIKALEICPKECPSRKLNARVYKVPVRYSKSKSRDTRSHCSLKHCPSKNVNSIHSKKSCLYSTSNAKGYKSKLSTNKKCTCSKLATNIEATRKNNPCAKKEKICALCCPKACYSRSVSPCVSTASCQHSISKEMNSRLEYEFGYRTFPPNEVKKNYWNNSYRNIDTTVNCANFIPKENTQTENLDRESQLTIPIVCSNSEIIVCSDVTLLEIPYTEECRSLKTADPERDCIPSKYGTERLINKEVAASAAVDSISTCSFCDRNMNDPYKNNKDDPIYATTRLNKNETAVSAAVDSISTCSFCDRNMNDPYKNNKDEPIYATTRLNKNETAVSAAVDSISTYTCSERKKNDPYENKEDEPEYTTEMVVSSVKISTCSCCGRNKNDVCKNNEDEPKCASEIPIKNAVVVSAEVMSTCSCCGRNNNDPCKNNVEESFSSWNCEWFPDNGCCKDSSNIQGESKKKLLKSKEWLCSPLENCTYEQHDGMHLFGSKIQKDTLKLNIKKKPGSCQDNNFCQSIENISRSYCDIKDKNYPEIGTILNDKEDENDYAILKYLENQYAFDPNFKTMLKANYQYSLIRKNADLHYKNNLMDVTNDSDVLNKLSKYIKKRTDANEVTSNDEEDHSRTKLFLLNIKQGVNKKKRMAKIERSKPPADKSSVICILKPCKNFNTKYY